MDEINYRGIMLKADDYSEYDRRCTILTAEYGKLTAFAHGARRQGNSLSSVTQPFVMGTFQLVPGRNAFTLRSAQISDYFLDIAMDLERTCYAAYFCDMAGYYSQEGIPAKEFLNLLYLSFKMMNSETMDKKLIRAIFEEKIICLEGEGRTSAALASERAFKNLLPFDASAAKAFDFVFAAPLQNVFRFDLTDEAKEKYIRMVKKLVETTMDVKLKSQGVLESIVN